MHRHGRGHRDEQQATAPFARERNGAAPGLPRNLMSERGMRAMQITAGNANAVQLVHRSGRAQGGNEHGAAPTPMTPSTAASAPVQRYHEPTGKTDENLAYVKKHAKSIITEYVAIEREARHFPELTWQQAVEEIARPKKADWVTIEKALTSALADQDFDKNLDPKWSVGLSRILNRMQERNETYRKSGEDTDSLVFGTEFTFTDAKLRGLVPPDEHETKDQKNARRQTRDHAYDVINRWTKRVTAPAGLKVRAEAVNDSSVKAPGNAVRFTYTKNSAVVWHWTLDVDQGCLETQTMPATAAELNGSEVAKIIQEHIFGVARSLKLETDVTKQGGSGHISVDVRSAFGGSVTLFVKTIEHLQSKAADWASGFHGDKVEEGYDKVNSPWLSDLAFKAGEDKGDKDPLAGLQALVQQLVKEATAGKLDIAGAARKLQEFDRRLTNPATKGHPRAAHILSEMSHYQAINTEHAGAPGGAARLELRDVPAQTGLDRLNKDLDFIKAMVTKVRKANQG